MGNSSYASKERDIMNIPVDNGPATEPTNADDDDGLLEVWGSVTPMVQPMRRKKRKRKASNHTGAAASVDAIDITGNTVAAIQTPEEQRYTAYKQTLGPLRMEFLSGTDGEAFRKTHSFGNTVINNSKIKSVRVQTSNIRNLHRELVQYALDLPATPQGSIFVRADESRINLLRVLITGPKGTPYANGCFFFDFHLNDYPNSPPKGKFLTTGGATVRFNPNLYNCGKICLSLLGTWAGPQWIPNQSTFLQVLISIQGLILVEDPYFNEPGYENNRKQHQEKAKQYNKNIRRQTLRWAIEDPLRRALDFLEGKETTILPAVDKSNYSYKKVPSTVSLQGYPEFAIVVVMHFAQQADEIEAQLQEWTAQDTGLKGHANIVRSLLKRVVEQKLYLSSQQTGDLKPAASNTTGKSKTLDGNISSGGSSARELPSEGLVIL